MNRGEHGSKHESERSDVIVGDPTCEFDELAGDGGLALQDVEDGTDLRDPLWIGLAEHPSDLLTLPEWDENPRSRRRRRTVDSIGEALKER